MSEALPTVVYDVRGVRVHESTLVAVGRFGSSWSEVPAVIDSEQPDAGRISPAWRIAHFEFEVAEKLAGSAESKSVAPGATLTVETYIPTDADLDRMGEGLRAFGRCVVFFTGGFPGDQTWGIAGDSTLLGTLEEDGTVHMQIDVDESGDTDRVDGMLVDLHSLADIRRAAGRHRTKAVLDDGTLSEVPPDAPSAAASTSPASSEPT